MIKIIEFIKKLFCKKNRLQIPPPKENKIAEKEFSLNLKRLANPSINDGNGFGIVKCIDLKEII